MMVWGSEGAAQAGKLNQTFWHRVCVCELKSDVKVLPLSLFDTWVALAQYIKRLAGLKYHHPS